MIKITIDEKTKRMNREKLRSWWKVMSNVSGANDPIQSLFYPEFRIAENTNVQQILNFKEFMLFYCAALYACETF